MLKSVKRNICLGVATLLTAGLMSTASIASAASVYEGKKVIFIPIAMGITLTEGWSKGMEEQAKLNGFDYEVRDAAFNMKAMSEIFAKAINDKPDIIVAHNPTVQLLARLIRQAESNGIKVLQINLQSNQKSTAFVGANWSRIGREVAEDIVAACGEGSGKSGKVAIIPGQLTAADSVMMNEATMAVFEKHPEIEVVSNQASDWEPEKARQITATVLQQNPDLCAVFGHWGIHTIGAGNAVKDAGKADDVLVYATGGGNRVICNNIEAGVIDRYWSYNADGQGRDAGTMLRLMMQGAVPPEGGMLEVESPLIVIKKESFQPQQCWDLPAK
ncbi:sugar ABC transporter substrate-binding protein [Sneathiella sp.]|jgi:ABC-type sugar transport system substrate-binding protein|uniref:sugar ABC transporter substrate-binding protein n=1 Tax=Sneathiella sp. TaxID=1964365 RepID=UPI0025E51C6E|nr:sugar ABC transporter substrate-binding protein [Sneathiella sp.]|tara:strand:+ start:74 stop:1063 length:990 start_codon:yes stop_codon:yes gene_type:complete